MVLFVSCVLIGACSCVFVVCCLLLLELQYLSFVCCVLFVVWVLCIVFLLIDC